MPYPTFDRSRLHLRPLSERVHDLHPDDWLALGDPTPPYAHPNLPTLAARIRAARAQGAPVMLLMGGHVIRAGVARHLVDLMSRGLITHVGMNGAAAIHDYEMALVGGTSESVARYISEGQFGLWAETGGLNDIIRAGAAEGLGLGEAVGRAIATGEGFLHRDLSVLAACYRLHVPATVHVGIGYDIIHEHPNADGAALGAASYRDFLALTQVLAGEPGAAGFEGGVLLSFGSAVMAPEVFLKALAMARNAAHQEGRVIQHFTTAVFDLLSLPGDLHHEAPKGTPEYYFRPYKTLLVRTVADGGESYYFRGEHRATIPALYRLLVGAKE